MLSRTESFYSLAPPSSVSFEQLERRRRGLPLSQRSRCLMPRPEQPADFLNCPHPPEVEGEANQPIRGKAFPTQPIPGRGGCGEGRGGGPKAAAGKSHVQLCYLSPGRGCYGDGGKQRAAAHHGQVCGGRTGGVRAVGGRGTRSVHVPVSCVNAFCCSRLRPAGRPFALPRDPLDYQSHPPTTHPSVAPFAREDGVALASLWVEACLPLQRSGL